MYRPGNPYTLAFGAMALSMFALAAVVYRRRSRRAALPLAIFLASVGLWTLGDALRIAAPSPFWILFWNKVAYFGVVWTPPTLLYYVAAITNREWYFRRRYVYATVAISAVAFLVVVTNPWHELWRLYEPPLLAGEVYSPGTPPLVFDERRGPAWVAWSVYSYLLIAGAMALLAREALDASRSRLYRVRTALVFVAIVVPTIANTLFTTFGVVEFDPVPLTLWVTGVAFAAAIFRYDLLDLAPIARDVVVSRVDSGVVVLDPNDVVVDANPVARAALDVDAEAVPGIELDALLADYPDVRDRLRGARDASETLTVTEEGADRHFEVDVSPIEDDLGNYLGRVITFTDVTDRIDRERRLRDQTERLRRRNERLDELGSIVSHDLRNPLDVTGRRARRLRSELESADLPPEVKAEIEAEIDGIERATERASEIAGELLDKSEGLDGHDADDDGESSADPAMLREVASDAFEAVESDDRDLAVRGSRPLTVPEDDLRQLLEQCYRTVLDHASDVTTVVVGATSDGFYVETEDDAGRPGDPNRDRAKEYSTDGAGHGTATVERLADAHGWAVDVVDADSGGTRIEVTTDR